jgi:sortase (surface protein transpeptidase)
MYTSLLKYVQETTIRHSIRVVAFVVFSAALCALLILHAYPRLVHKNVVTPSPNEVTRSVGTTTPPVQRALPTLLEIPSLNMMTTFEAPLGLKEDNRIEVPDSFEQVGWYKLGASPGEIGPAVILGHVDSVDGPAVFYSLGQLKEGDMIYVTRADDTVATFMVEYSERYAQDAFPTTKVYGTTTASELRLITCTGTFSKGKQRYSHNLVVYARLVSVDMKHSMILE